MSLNSSDFLIRSEARIVLNLIFFSVAFEVCHWIFPQSEIIIFKLWLYPSKLRLFSRFSGSRVHSCFLNWLNAINNKCIIMVFHCQPFIYIYIYIYIYIFKMIGLRKFKEFAKKTYETEWNFSTIADVFLVILQIIPSIDFMFLLDDETLKVALLLRTSCL